MDSKKQIDLLRKRNAQLQSEIEELQKQDVESYINSFKKTLEELEQEKSEYQKLINEIKEIKEHLIQCK